MKIIIADYSGFCYGVERAVDIALKKYDKKTYTYGQIIHNGEFQKKMDIKGVHIEIDLNKIKNSNLIIRSHGVKKSVYIEAENNNINVIDATCPYVKKIHNIVEKEYNKNRKILIIGDKNHPEVLGINGWCENSAIIINNTNNLNYLLSILKKSDRISVVCQTTFDLLLYNKLRNALNDVYIDIVFFDTICLATANRQKSAEELSKKVDLMIVVGGKNSSNTNKLYKICKKNTKTLFLQTEKDFYLSDLTNVNSIGIVGGASTPDWVINNILKKINNEGEGF
jgi:4-hydroxy-3-methylbut-2-enyl diphosphate reductase